jgi:hypothetical protein
MSSLLTFEKKAVITQARKTCQTFRHAPSRSNDKTIACHPSSFSPAVQLRVLRCGMTKCEFAAAGL